MQGTIHGLVLHHKGLGCLSHQEHREVVALLLGLFHVAVDQRKRLLVTLVCDGYLAVAWTVDTVHIVQSLLDGLRRGLVAQRNHSDAGLLQELDMRLWNVARAFYSGFVVD